MHKLLLVCTLACLCVCAASHIPEAQALQHLSQLLQRGEAHEIISYTNALQEQQPDFVSEFSNAHIVFHYRAMAGERTANYTLAAASYEQALQLQPGDEILTIKLAEVHAMYLKPNKAIALLQPLAQDKPELWTKLVRYKSWACHWDRIDLVQSVARKTMIRCMETDECKWLLASESALAPPRVSAYVSSFFDDTTERSPLELPPQSIAPISTRLKVGFISSDFGVHPVSTLVRGLLQMMDREKFEVFCFSVTSETSWWRTNITSSVEHFYDLAKFSTPQAAKFIANLSVNILIDLNGRTRHSGLDIMSFRPAPVQVSFLGLPTTTTASYIDYFMTDWVASPPAEDVLTYSEKLVLVPPCYIVNDYAQVRGRYLDRERADPADLELRVLGTKERGIRNAGPLLNTLSNFMKIDQKQWIVWMNILRRVPEATFVLTEFEGRDDAIPNLAEHLPYFGINDRQVLSTPQQPWIIHTWQKSAYDLILDTWQKNGHTTGQDPIWGGVPAVTMHGNIASRRSAMSIAAAFGRADGITFSLKEYEDLAVELLKNPTKLEALRLEIKRLRTQTRLFNTKFWTDQFSKTLHGLWEQFKISTDGIPRPGMAKSELRSWLRDATPRPTPFPHQFTTDPPLFVGLTEAPTLNDDDLTGSKTLSLFSDEMREIFKSAGQNILLNIGGTSPRAGWVNINAQAGPGTHLQADMSHLDMFGDNTVTAIYTSHTFEHVPYFQNVSAMTTLKEWYRVLKPGGKLMISVPNIRVLAAAILDDSLPLQERFMVMRMVYGAQSDDYDFHYAGYDFELLSAFLTAASFCEIEEVEGFGLFSDTSTKTFGNYTISLNVVAKACHKLGPEVTVGIPLVSKRRSDKPQ